MKSLAESILSSTDSGKKRKIDVEYLLKHDFEPDDRYGSPKTMFTHKELGQSLRTVGDKIVLDVFKYSSLSRETLVVSTIEDLDLVIELFKELNNGTKTKQDKLKKELFKKLKEL